jgi:hypothetical protein
MLAAYLAATQNLLQNPAAPSPLYSTASLTTYINTARGQLAGETQCCRYICTVALSAAQQVYAFSAIVIPSASANGINDVLNVRTIWLESGSGTVWLQPEPFEQFSVYELNSTSPSSGSPAKWAQFAQGVNGSIYLSPVPSSTGTLMLDCVCNPLPLTSDSSPEAIPYQFTDAVPYFAAYLALLSAQTGARTAEADKMLQRYDLFVKRARSAATPDVLPWVYEQVPVPGGLNMQPQQRRAQ